MTLARIKARWTIPGAGTAYSVLHFSAFAGEEPTVSEVNGVLTKVRTFYNAITPTLPNVVKIDVLPEAEIINTETGDMIGVVAGTAPTQVVGTAGAAVGWAAAAGAVVTWTTAGVRNSRRVRGRTFLVPLANSVWDVDGTITSVAMNYLTPAAAALRADGAGAGSLGVYARPTSSTASDGIWYQALAHRIPDMSAVLRSRRA